MKNKEVFINILIIIFELLGFLQGLSLDMFLYYTNLSNFVALIACILLVISNFTKNMIFRKCAENFKYMATCMTTLTIIVVACILVPMQGIKMLYTGNFIYFHMICPILMFLSFLWFDDRKEDELTIKIGLFPTFLYATIVIFLNIIDVIEGPYPFLMVKKQPIFMSIVWFVVVIGIACVIAYGIIKIRRKLEKK